MAHKMSASTTNKTVNNTTASSGTLVSAVVATGNIRNRVCIIQIRTRVAWGDGNSPGKLGVKNPGVTGGQLKAREKRSRSD